MADREFLPGDRQGIPGEEHQLAAHHVHDVLCHGRPPSVPGHDHCFHLQETEGACQHETGSPVFVQGNREPERGPSGGQQEAVRPQFKDSGIRQDQAGIHNPVSQHPF